LLLSFGILRNRKGTTTTKENRKESKNEEPRGSSGEKQSKVWSYLETQLYSLVVVYVAFAAAAHVEKKKSM